MEGSYGPVGNLDTISLMNLISLEISSKGPTMDGLQ